RSSRRRAWTRNAAKQARRRSDSIRVSSLTGGRRRARLRTERACRQLIRLQHPSLELTLRGFHLALAHPGVRGVGLTHGDADLRERERDDELVPGLEHA